MSVKSQIKSFLREFKAVMNGDSDGVTAEKAFRQSQSALATAIATVTGDLIAKEDAVEAAQERLRRVRVNNGQLITDRSEYLRNLVDARNDLIGAEQALADHRELIEFYQTEKSKAEQMVDAPEEAE